MSFLNDEQKSEMIAQRASGESVEDIALHFGVGRATVSRITNPVSPPGGWKPKRRRKMTDDQKQDAIARRAAGENAKSIARSYGVDTSTIYSIAKHVPKPPGGWKRKRRSLLTDEQTQQVVARRLAGESVKDIAGHFGVSSGLICKVLSEAAPPDGWGFRLTKEQKHEAVVRRMAGETLDEIARRFDVSAPAIYGITKHVPSPAGGWKQKRRGKITDVQKQEAIARRMAGESLEAIARSFNVSAPAIHRITKHLPKPFRSRTAE